MSWNSSIKNTTKDTSSCMTCFISENSLILLHFVRPPKPIRTTFCVILVFLICASVCLNMSSMYFIWREIRRRTHVNLLLSAQSLADIFINLMVMLPISLIAVTNTLTRPNYHICMLISFLDHWFHSITMLSMAEIITDRYKVIVQRELSAITRQTEKSMAVITVIWVATFVLSISYVTPFLRKTNWGSVERSCDELKECYHPKNFFQWIEELITRIMPFVLIFYCFSRMMWLTYRSKHRVGVKNSMANWKTVLVGIYSKSVKTCLLMMTLFLIGTLPELVISIAVSLNKPVDSNALLLATWLRFCLTVLKPAVYMVQSGKRFLHCWFFACCRNMNVIKLVTMGRRPSISAAHSTTNGSLVKASFTKTHDLFAINLHIEDVDATVSGERDARQMKIDEINCKKVNVIVKNI